MDDDIREDFSLDQFDWDSLLAELPEFKVDEIFQNDDASLVVADGPSSNAALSQIENLLMDDNDNAALGTPSSKSDYDKLLAEILFEDGSTPSQNDRVDAETPEDVSDEPMSKKQRRQMRNRDAAVKSRERKKMYVKDLEMKSRYFEGECRRLGYLLQCCYAENHALRICLQARGGAFGASMTKLESAVLLLESLPLVSLLWFMGILCQLSLPLMLWLAAALPREKVSQRGLKLVARKEPESEISVFLWMQSFVKSRRCRSSRTKMKLDFHVLCM